MSLYDVVIDALRADNVGFDLLGLADLELVVSLESLLFYLGVDSVTWVLIRSRRESWVTLGGDKWVGALVKVVLNL
jgi:hypothetical protein